jgi:N-acetylglucosaminyl-diphospho-decaprenol L-rhamnosyltransferase
VTAARIVAVVPNKDGAGLVGRCVAAALAGGAEEIVVVDDGSTDDSPAEAAAAGARVLQSSGRGFAAAVNTGFDGTAGDSLLLLNSDCFLEPSTLPLLAETLAADASLGAVGAGLLDASGAPAKSHGRVLTPWHAFRNDVLVKPPPLPSRTTGVEQTEFLPLACVLVRRRLLEALGGLDERFPFYFEDQDFALRARGAGWRLAVRWDARATHVGGGSSAGRDAQRWTAQFYRSRALFLRTHYGVPARLHAVAWSAIALGMAAAWRLRRAPAARRWSRAYVAAARAAWLSPDAADHRPLLRGQPQPPHERGPDEEPGEPDRRQPGE